MTVVAAVAAVAAVAMVGVVAMVARTRGELLPGTMLPSLVLAAKTAVVLPPIRVERLLGHLVPFPVEDPRRKSEHNHVAEMGVIVMLAAVMMPLARGHRLHAQSKHCQYADHRRSQSFHLLVSLDEQSLSGADLLRERAESSERPRCEQPPGSMKRPSLAFPPAPAAGRATA